MWTVYKHTFPNGKVYIGITSRKPEERWGFSGNNYKHNVYMDRAIKKYGWNNIQHDVLMQGLTKEEAYEKEIELIAKYKSATKEHGYNIALGGQGGNKTDEQKAKVSEQFTKLWQDDEFRQKQIKARKNYWATTDRKLRTGTNNKLYGIPLKESTKRKIAEKSKQNNNARYLNTPEVRAKNIQSIRKNRCKPVSVYTSDGTEWLYSSTLQAAKGVGCKKNVIIVHCRTKRITQKGFYCEYIQDQQGGEKLATLLCSPDS